MIAIVTGIVVLLGGLFALVAGIGMLKMPDMMLRMHASTKSGTLACGLTLVAAALAFGDLHVTVRAMGVLLFLLLTAPVAAHMIGRAALRTGLPVLSWDHARGERVLRPAEEFDRSLESEASPPPRDPLVSGRDAQSPR